MRETTTRMSGLTGLGCVVRCDGETIGTSDYVGLELVGIWHRNGTAEEQHKISETRTEKDPGAGPRNGSADEEHKVSETPTEKDAGAGHRNGSAEEQNKNRKTRLTKYAGAGHRNGSAKKNGNTAMTKAGHDNNAEYVFEDSFSVSF